MRGENPVVVAEPVVLGTALCGRYSVKELERRKVDPAKFYLWLRRYEERCRMSGIVEGFADGIPVLSMHKAGEPGWREKCSALGLCPAGRGVAGPYDGRRTNDDIAFGVST